MYLYLMSQRDDICFSKSIHILILFHFSNTFKNFLQYIHNKYIMLRIMHKKSECSFRNNLIHCECESWNKVASKDPPLSTHCCFYKESDNSKATKTYILCPILSKESDRITFCVNFARGGFISEGIFNLVTSSNN